MDFLVQNFRFEGQDFGTKLDALNCFLEDKLLFKAQECKNLRAFDFFQLLNKNYIIKMQFTIQFFWEKPIS